MIGMVIFMPSLESMSGETKNGRSSPAGLTVSTHPPHGAPIVAADIPGNRHLLQGDEPAALWVDPESPRQIASGTSR